MSIAENANNVSNQEHYYSNEQYEPTSLFLTWCQRSSGSICSRRSFAKFIKRFIPSAIVTATFRERNSHQIRFYEDGENTSAPVEYWRVSWRDREFLFPQPRSHSFLELTPVFVGQNTQPCRVVNIKPALLAPSQREGEFGLDQPGLVEHRLAEQNHSG